MDALGRGMFAGGGAAGGDDMARYVPLPAGGAGSTGGGGASTSDEKRKQELFKLGLRIDGTHTRMSDTAEGDKYDIPGDGWCFYSSFLAGFEKYNFFLQKKGGLELPDIVPFNRNNASPTLWRHATALQFTKFLAESIRKSETLKQKFCDTFSRYVMGAIKTDDSGNITGYTPYDSIRKVTNKDGKDSGMHGFKLDEDATNSDNSWIHYPDMCGAKVKYVPLGNLENLTKVSGLDLICTNFDINTFLLNMWKPRYSETNYLPYSETNYLPMMYGDGNIITAVIKELYPWITFETLAEHESIKPNNNFIIKKQQSTGVGGDTLHFNATVYEYVPPELDVFPAGSPYWENVLKFVTATDDSRKNMIDKWVAEWNTTKPDENYPELDAALAESRLTAPAQGGAAAQNSTTPKNSYKRDPIPNSDLPPNSPGLSPSASGNSVTPLRLGGTDLQSPPESPSIRGSDTSLNEEEEVSALNLDAAEQPADESDPLKEAASAVADLMGAVIGAAEKLLKTKTGVDGSSPAPAQPGRQSGYLAPPGALPAPASSSMIDPFTEQPKEATPDELIAAIARENLSSVLIPTLKSSSGVVESKDDEYDPKAIAQYYYTLSWSTLGGKIPEFPTEPLPTPLPTYPAVPTGPLPTSLPKKEKGVSTPSGGASYFTEITASVDKISESIKAKGNSISIQELLFYRGAIAKLSVELQSVTQDQKSTEVAALRGRMVGILNIIDEQLKRVRRPTGEGGAAAGKGQPLTGGQELDTILAGLSDRFDKAIASTKALTISSSSKESTDILTELAGLRSQIDEALGLRKEVDSLKQQLTGIKRLIPTAYAELQGFEQRLTEDEGNYARLRADITRLRGLIESLQQPGAAVGSDVQTADIATFEDTLNSLEERLRGLEGRQTGTPPPSSPDQSSQMLQDILARFDALTKRVDSLTLPITGGSPAPDASTVKANLQAKADAVLKEISDEKIPADAVTALQGQLDLLETQGRLNKEDIENIRKLLQQLQSVTPQITGGGAAGGDQAEKASSMREGFLEQIKDAIAALEIKPPPPPTQAQPSASPAEINQMQQRLRILKRQLRELQAPVRQILLAATGGVPPVSGAGTTVAPPIVSGPAFTSSWFNPNPDPKLVEKCAGGYITTKDCTAARIFTDVAGFQGYAEKRWVERPEEPLQKKYTDLLAFTKRKSFEDLADRLAGAEDKREQMKKKIRETFPDRTVRIDGKEYTVRNPYAALGDRQALADVSGDRYSLPLGDASGGLYTNLQVLHAFAPLEDFREFLVDNKRAIAVLESLWHCGNQQGADLNPACFPARIVEELREYKALEINKRGGELATAVLSRSYWPTVAGYAAKLKGALEALRPLGKAAVTTKKPEETQAGAAPGAGAEKGKGQGQRPEAEKGEGPGQGQGQKGGVPPRRSGRRPLLLPGLGAGRPQISYGGTVRLRDVIPELSAGLGS